MSLAEADPASRVAVVTGAARGIGRGIALTLGARGWTVHVTDRTTRSHPHPTLPGSVEDTALAVDRLGGRGYAWVVDHSTGDAAFGALCERIRDDHGGLDVLVSNAFAGNDIPFAPAPFWQLSTRHWDNMFTVGVRSHIVTASCAAPLLIARGGCLLMTGYASGGESVLGGHLYYDLAMRATSRLAVAMAADLREHGVTAVVVSPGFTATEAIVAASGGRRPTGSDSVAFVGAVVHALVADAGRIRYSGATLSVADLAGAYAIADPEPGGAA